MDFIYDSANNLNNYKKDQRPQYKNLVVVTKN